LDGSAQIPLKFGLNAFHWAADPGRPFIQNVGVAHGGFYITVAEQFLNGAKVVTSLQKMGCE
jgi:hypothetical protein